MEAKVQSSFKRYEEKYMLTMEQQKMLLKGMKEHMKPDIYGKTTNCNIYYDTDNWELIRKSIEKPVYKEKLRVRSYGVPKKGDTVFVEIKKKFDDVVYKRRTTIAAEDSEKYLAGDKTLSPGSQIGNEIEWFQKIYKAKPKVYIAYDRTSFAGFEDSELIITFDQNIRFREYSLDLRKGDFGKNMLPEDTVLMEIKIPGTAREITAIFMAMALGLATGMGYITLAIIFFIIMALFQLAMCTFNFGGASGNGRDLRITIPEDLDYEGIFDDIFQKYTTSARLESVKTSNLGTLYELRYDIALKSDSVPKAFLDEIRTRNGNLNIVCGRVQTKETL